MKHLALYLIAFFFSVNSHAQVLYGPDSLCVGSSSTLSASMGGGTWSMSGYGIIDWGGYGGTITGIGTGTVAVNYVLTSTGASYVKYITVYSTCTGRPSGGIASASPSAFCYADPITLTATGASTDCGLIHTWQYSSDSVHWTNLSMYSVSSTTTPAGALYYRHLATCYSSGLSDTSNTIYVPPSRGIFSHSVIPAADTLCSGPEFYLHTCGNSLHYSVISRFGDGSADTTPSHGYRDFHIRHAYISPGSYTVQQTLYDSSAAIDSISFPFEYNYCRTLPVKFYYDANANCVFDSGDTYLTHPLTIEVDSNGDAIDTLVATSGIYQPIYGPPGTIYAFKIIAAAGGFIASCPTSGIIYDTISTATGYATKFIGFNCSSTSDFDLSVNATMNCRPLRADARIIVANSYCRPINSMVTMTFDSIYHYHSAYPAPTSVVGHTISWYLDSISSLSPPAYIDVAFLPDTAVALGRPIHSTYDVAPTTGDVYELNNSLALVNSVSASYDPNEISVTPSGKIIPCTPLRYTIKFENTGNDTAHNIAVIDTLPANVDVKSIKVVAATAVMNLAILKDRGTPIVKFDFPNINLLDSSHHNECEGMVVFDVQTKSGLADGTTVTNRAGIYFDDNPVVMTNSISNTIGIEGIVLADDSVCIGTALTAVNETPSGIWSFSNAVATISPVGVLTAISEGAGTISYTVSNVCGSKTATATLSVDSVHLPSVSIELKHGPTHPHDALIAHASHAGHLPGYQWYVNHTLVTGATSAAFTGYSFLNGDSVSCVVTARGDCGYASFNAVIVHIDPSGISLAHADQSEFQLWPNPTQGNITISCLNAGQMTVYNMHGISIGSYPLSAGENAVSLPSLPAGIYTCRYTSNTGDQPPFVVKLLLRE